MTDSSAAQFVLFAAKKRMLCKLIVKRVLAGI